MLNKLKMSLMGRGFTWLDTGTHQSMLEASNYIETIQNRQGLMVSCLEEIAYKKKFITFEELSELTNSYPNSSYKDYLLQLLKD